MAIQKWARELAVGSTANAKEKAMAATAQPRGGMRALFGL
jgi:hypothetical protein